MTRPASPIARMCERLEVQRDQLRQELSERMWAARARHPLEVSERLYYVDVWCALSRTEERLVQWSRLARAEQQRQQE